MAQTSLLSQRKTELRMRKAWSPPQLKYAKAYIKLLVNPALGSERDSTLLEAESSKEESAVTGTRYQSSPPNSIIDQKLLVDVHTPDGFKVGKISPSVYLTNWIGHNAVSEIFLNDWFEDTYDHDNGNGALHNKVGANDVSENHSNNDETVDYKDNNHDGAFIWQRSSYGSSGSWKNSGRDGGDGGEETSSTYGSQRTSRNHVELSASGDNTAFGDRKGDRASVGSRVRVMGNRGKVVNETNEESEALELNKGETCSKKDCPGLERIASQNFEHQWESVGRSEASSANSSGAAPTAPDDENDNMDIPEATESGFSASPSSSSNISGRTANAEFASAILYAGLVEVPEKSPKKPSEVPVKPLDVLTICETLYVSPACKKPLIYMYEKDFTICCGSLWGVNFNLYLMDRRGKADITNIKQRPFHQIQVAEPLNLLITISRHKNTFQIYHLTWLRNKIFNDDPKSKREEILKTEVACKAIDKLADCEHFSVFQHAETTYITIVVKSSIHLYEWAPKTFDESTAIKVCPMLGHKPMTVDLAIDSEKRLKVFFSSADGYHIIDAESEVMSDMILPNKNTIVLPDSLGIGMMLTFNVEALSMKANEYLFKNILEVWKDIPSSAAYACTQQTTGWGQKATEVHFLQSRLLENELKHRPIKKLRFLCTRSDKLFFTSVLHNCHSLVYFMTLGKLEELQSNYGI
ncbi:LOW QUALITY PROTEIN: nik-related protein kinase [Glossophaga mutica]